jgi:hypothetical protein
VRYPSEFDNAAIAVINVAMIRGRRAHAEAQSQYGHRFDPTRSAREWVMNVFLAWARAAIKLGKEGIWEIDEVSEASFEGLRLITIEVSSTCGLRYWVSNWNGSVTSDRMREFQSTSQWRQFEDELLVLAESMAGRFQTGDKTDVDAAATSAGNPIEKLPVTKAQGAGQDKKRILFNEQLAQGILEALAAVFPNKLELRDLRSVLPDHQSLPLSEWLQAIDVLRLKGKIDGVFRFGESSIEYAAAVYINSSGYSQVRAQQAAAARTESRGSVGRTTDFPELPLRFQEEFEATMAKAEWQNLALEKQFHEQLAQLNGLFAKRALEAANRLPQSGIQTNVTGPVITESKKVAGELDQLAESGRLVTHPEETIPATQLADTAPKSPVDPSANASQGRKRGPQIDFETAHKVDAIIARLAPDGNWRENLEDICEALDEADVRRPKPWKDKGYRRWSSCLAGEPELVIKAIGHHLANASLYKGTFS